MDMNIRNLRKQLGDTQSDFARRYHIPFRTIQNWETGVRKPPEYIVDLRCVGNCRSIEQILFQERRKFEGISVAPEYQERFEKMMVAAIEYYDE